MTSKRLAILAGVAVLAGCAIAASLPYPHVPADTVIDVTNTAVALFSADPTKLTVGKLIYRGGVSVEPANAAFGGLSALKISADGSRFASVEDEGVWVTGGLTYDDKGNLTGMTGVHLAPELNPDGSPIASKAEGDSESLAFADPFDLKGDAFVGYEGDNRVMRFDYAKDGTAAKPTLFKMPGAIQTLRNNTGLEVLAGLPGGKLLAISEEGPKDENDDSLGFVVDEATGAAVSFRVKRMLPYALTDAAALPDGRVILLERRFAVTTGPGARLRILDPKTFTEGATVDGEVVGELFSNGATVDNMEGIAARKDANGKTLITIISDDNFQRPLQRTLLMMFELAE